SSFRSLPFPISLSSGPLAIAPLLALAASSFDVDVDVVVAVAISLALARVFSLGVGCHSCSCTALLRPLLCPYDLGSLVFHTRRTCSWTYWVAVVPAVLAAHCCAAQST